MVRQGGFPNPTLSKDVKKLELTNQTKGFGSVYESLYE